MGTPFLSRPSCFSSQRFNASFPQFSSQTHSEYVEQTSLALQLCSSGATCWSHASRADGGAGLTGLVAAGGVFRHLSWPRFSISTALVTWQQEEQSAGGPDDFSTSQSLADQSSWNGFSTRRQRSASEREVMEGGVTSQSLSPSPCSSSSSEATISSDSSIFSMEKEELQLLTERTLLIGQGSCTSHASRSMS